MSAEATYLDSSALVKLVRAEAETMDLRDFLADREHRVASDLATVEVLRAARRSHPDAHRKAQEVLDGIDLLRIDTDVLQLASTLDPPDLRSLDAIHVASALTLGAALRDLVAYDHRLRDASEANGLTVVSPGASPHP